MSPTTERSRPHPCSRSYPASQRALEAIGAWLTAEQEITAITGPFDHLTSHYSELARLAVIDDYETELRDTVKAIPLCGLER